VWGVGAQPEQRLVLSRAKACDVVYATAGYEKTASNLSSTSLARDTVFGIDGGIHQIASMSGSVAAGHTAGV
jgi:hypothetical protein